MRIQRPHHAVRVQFAHAHQAGAGQGHEEIRVAIHQIEHRRALLLPAKGHLQDSTAPRGFQGIETLREIPRQMHGFGERRFARPKWWTKLGKTRLCPWMVFLWRRPKGGQWPRIRQNHPAHSPRLARCFGWLRDLAGLRVRGHRKGPRTIRGMKDLHRTPRLRGRGAELPGAARRVLSCGLWQRLSSAVLLRPGP